MASVEKSKTDPVLVDGVFVFPNLKWQRALRDDEDLSPKAKDLGLWLATFADSEGRHFPGRDRLRLLTTNDDGKPVSVKTISRRRKELVDAGWLVLLKPGLGRGESSVYTLAWPSVKRDREPAVKRDSSPSENGTPTVPLSEAGRESAESTPSLTKRREELTRTGTPLEAAPIPSRVVECLPAISPPDTLPVIDREIETDRVTRYSAASEDYRAGDDFPSASDWFSAEPPKVALGIPCRPNSRTTYA